MLNMSSFVPTKEYLQGILLHYFIKRKCAAEVHRIHVEIDGDHDLSETTCRDFFRYSKNNYFAVEDKKRSDAPKKLEGIEGITS